MDLTQTIVVRKKGGKLIVYRSYLNDDGSFTHEDYPYEAV